MPAHFVEAAGFEADRYRSVHVLLQGLARVEEEGCGVGGGAGVEAEFHLDRGLLEGAEGAPGEGLQVEDRVGLEIVEAEPCIGHVGETPEAGLAAPVGPGHQEGAVAVEQAARLRKLAAQPAMPSSFAWRHPASGRF